MRKKAEKEPKVYRKQFVLFPELWGGDDYVLVEVKKRRKRKPKLQKQ